MSLSDAQIVNLALAQLGAKPIAALTDNTQGAMLANQLFEPARNMLLEMFPWTWARKQAALAKSSTTPVFSTYAYAYALPSDCLSPVRLEGGDEWEVYGDRLLYTNADSEDGDVNLEYVAKVTDNSLYSHVFVQCLAALLAAQLALPLKNDAPLAQRLLGVYQGWLSAAMQQTALQGDRTEDWQVEANYGWIGDRA